MCAALNPDNQHIDIRSLTENEDDDEMKLPEGGVRYRASLLNFKEFLTANIKQMTGIMPMMEEPLYGLRYVEDDHNDLSLELKGNEITLNGNCLFDSLLYIENDGHYEGSGYDRLDAVRQLRVELFEHAIRVKQTIEYTDIVRQGKDRKALHKPLNLKVEMHTNTFVPAEIIKTYCDLKKKHIMLFTIYNTGTLRVDLYLNRTVPLEHIDFVMLHHSHFTTLRRVPGFSQNESSFFKNLCNKSFTDFGRPFPTYSELCSGTRPFPFNRAKFEDRILQSSFAQRYSELYIGLFTKPSFFDIKENANVLRLIEETKTGASNQSGAGNQSGPGNMWEHSKALGIKNDLQLRLALKMSQEHANADNEWKRLNFGSGANARSGASASHGWGGAGASAATDRWGLETPGIGAGAATGLGIPSSVGFGKTPNNHKPSPLVGDIRDGLRKAQANARARANATARAQANATARARANANATARAQANATARARANANANARARANATARARANATARAKQNAKNRPKSFAPRSPNQYENNNEIIKKVLEESIQSANKELKKRTNERNAAAQKVSTLSNNSKSNKKLNKYANLYATNNNKERIIKESIQTEREERKKRMKERRAAASQTHRPSLSPPLPPPLPPLPPLPGSTRRFRPSSIFNTHIPRMFGYSGNKTFRKK
jgi:hypothetical protein